MPATALASIQNQQESPLQAARRFHAEGALLQAAESYRKALSQHPHSQLALLGMSLIARQSGQLLPALHMAQAAVEASPACSIAHTTLAHAYRALHDLPLAEKHFRDSIRLNPSEIPALLGLADLFTATLRLNPASTLYQRALTLRPNLAAAHFGLGNILALQEAYTPALARFSTALACESQAPSQFSSLLHFSIAYAHSKLGQETQAIHHYRQAVTLQPSFAAAWLNLGVSLIADGRDLLAELCYQQAIAADPTLPSPHLNLGNLERSRRQFDRAQVHYTRALELDPRNPDVHVAFAYLHLEQNHFPPAHRALQSAQECCPAALSPEIPNARGILLLAEAVTHADPRKIEAAIAQFTLAETLGHKTAPSNRGNAHLRLGRVQQALEAHQAAVRLNPIHPGARYNLALTQLRMGNQKEGWANYEARLSFRDIHPRPRRYLQPRWLGQSLFDFPSDRRRLLLYTEQGLGDTIQFVRYLPLVAERGAEILLLAQPPLARLLKPFVKSLGGQLISHGEALPSFSLHCPLLSLPAVFRSTLATLPCQIPYLKANPALSAARLNELSSPPVRPAVGLAWAGNPQYPADRDRSTQLSTFLSLLQAFPSFRFVSLQKGDPARQIASLPVEHAPLDASSNDVDLAETAALVANLDLVITTDTVIAHLAGALGKPLWLLLPWQSDWRWMQQTLSTPWYPQARLFRQSAPGNWAELIERVIAALHEEGLGIRTETVSL